MAKRYILAQYDADKNLVLSPCELVVNPGDAVIWIARLDSGSTYIAHDFVFKNSKGPLFPQTTYEMPGDGESTPPAIVDPEIKEKESWSYTCSEIFRTKAAADGDSGQGIIIVDPPPLPDDNDEKSPAQQEQEVEVA